jgi:hypothetical protein
MELNTFHTEKETPVFDLRTRAENYLHICQMEMKKATPDFDRVYDFSEKALRCIGTLRIMTTSWRA